MLTRLRRWLGWDADSGRFALGAAEAKRPRPPIKPAAPTKPQAQPAKPPAAKTARTPGKPDAAQPQLSLGKPPAEDGFDPYNTGAFNRSQSWEKISRRGR